MPRRYRTPNGTNFKARANHYAHVLRTGQREDSDDIWVLHMDDDTGVGPDTAIAMARFIDGSNLKPGPRPSTWPRAFSPIRANTR